MTSLGSKSHLRVLSLEDFPDSIADVVGSLRDAGSLVEQAGTFEGAVELVYRNAYDLILVDARVPRKGQLQVEAGPEFLRLLGSTPNAATPFLVLTSFPHEIDVSNLRNLPGFLALLNKASVTGEILEEILGIDLDLKQSERPGEFMVEDLLVTTTGL